jgi:hypothetical protein
MTLDEAKQYLGNRYVLNPNYRHEDNPQHSLYEPVNIRLTFAHIRHSDVKQQRENV